MKQVMWTNSAYERVLSTQEEKDNFYQRYNLNTELLDVIAAALKEKITICDDSIQTKDMYKDPSWAYRQADAIGEKRALREVIQLLTIRDRELSDDQPAK